MTSYEYDSTGKLRYSYRAFDGGDTAVFHYWYGIHRELLVRTWEHPDGSRGSETYRYNEDGLLTEGIYENMDGWLNGTLVFKHDLIGNSLLFCGSQNAHGQEKHAGKDDQQNGYNSSVHLRFYLL